MTKGLKQTVNLHDFIFAFSTVFVQFYPLPDQMILGWIYDEVACFPPNF
jgi:hypothetical protein